MNQAKLSPQPELEQVAHMIVCPLHFHRDPVHQQHVIEAMQTLGSPTLRGFVDHGTGFVLLSEGTHRIHAAAWLGLTPRIVCVRWWRSSASLKRARCAANVRGLSFASVELLGYAALEVAS